MTYFQPTYFQPTYFGGASLSPISGLDDDLEDYIASVAARVAGIVEVFGTGQGVIGDPFNPGQTIRAAPDAPTGPWTFWVDLPSGKGVWLTQDLAESWDWDFPCRLWLPRGDLANMRRLARPMYRKLADAFAQDRDLGGRVQSCRITAFDIGSDASWAWMDVNLIATEHIDAS
jgi:hypothetical protein